MQNTNLQVQYDNQTEHTLQCLPSGWVCPKCGAVMAPHMNVCINCKGEPPTYNTLNSLPNLTMNALLNDALEEKDSLKTLEEYMKEHPEITNQYGDFGEFSEPKFKCPKCGGNVRKNLSIVLTSYPPQYRYDCEKCGHSIVLHY